LQTSAKGKLSVTYTLLRKPLKDNLLLLEWLAADPEELLTKFLGDSIIRIESGYLQPAKKKRIIEGAQRRSLYGNIFSTDFLYDLRYNKQALYGFEQIWNKATHIITNREPYATEEANLNFVFSDWESRISQWDYLYDYLPMLLLHAVGVVDAALRPVCSLDENDQTLTYLNRFIGFQLWIESKPTPLDPIPQERFQEIVNGLGAKCHYCGENFEISPKDANKFFSTGKIRCRKCLRISLFTPYQSISRLPETKIP